LKINATTIIVTVLILGFIGGGIYYMAKMDIFEDFSIGKLIDKFITIEVDVDAGSTGYTQPTPAPAADGGVDICATLTDNYPAYVMVREMTCAAFGADWRCKPDQVGCFNIPAWNSSQCNTNTELQQLKAFCAATGSSFVCTSTTIACTR